MGSVASKAASFLLPVSVVAIDQIVKLFRKPPSAPPPHLRAQPEGEDCMKEKIMKARKEMGVDCMKHYNFAVTGQTGVGKSSFINGLLSLEGDDTCSVGEVETTQKIKSYYNVKWPTLKVWDLPGAGTTRHPVDTYFEDMKLYAFDAILILSADRFLQVDFDILRSARKFKMPCVFVRTKCDIAVDSRAKRDKVTAFEAGQRIRTDVLRSFHEGLHNAGASEWPPQLFFISNEFFSDGPDAYSLCTDRRKNVWDWSLPSMDERLLVTFLVDTAQRRA